MCSSDLVWPLAAADIRGVAFDGPSVLLSPGSRSSSSRTMAVTEESLSVHCQLYRNQRFCN